MSKFHIGDKVKCIDNFFKYTCKNKIGRIVDFDDDIDGAVAVEFEDYVDGHSLDGRGHLGHCLYLPDHLLIGVDIESNTPLCSCDIEANAADNKFTAKTSNIKDKSEFTDKEILDSLYTCSRHGCIGCSLKGHDHCITQLLILAIELIQRQQKEINNAKSYKEFAKKVATDVAMTEKEKKI